MLLDTDQARFCAYDQTLRVSNPASHRARLMRIAKILAGMYVIWVREEMIEDIQAIVAASEIACKIVCFDSRRTLSLSPSRWCFYHISPGFCVFSNPEVG